MEHENLIEPDVEKDLEQDAEQEKAVEPPWDIFIHNDAVTPYDFVIVILVRVFGLTPVIAEYVTYSAHTKGQALVATLPKDEAQQKVGQAHFAAQLEGFPLRFTMEPAD